MKLKVKAFCTKLLARFGHLGPHAYIVADKIGHMFGFCIGG